MITAWLAFLADLIIGDPKSSYHPVALIGRLIGGMEKVLLVPAHRPRRQIAQGGLLVVIVLAFIYFFIFVIVQYIDTLPAWAALTANAVLLSFTITPRSLAEAGREIRDYLQNDMIGEARHKVGWIVGRDTEKLATPEVTRATVETIAENTVDGIISPLFYFFIGGVPLAFLYRAVNTLDSMVAYKNERYLYFGRVAAYVDDAFNYIPARITALLIILSAFILRLNHRNALRMIRRDAAKHPSPNGGYSEAGVAGALDVQLGGLNYYFGQPSLRASMGDQTNALEPRHISQTISIMYAVTVLFLAFACMAVICLKGWCLA